ncbi:MAG: hypothetical protein WA584_12180 [Pyrinomonadaceae bacterium]
MKPLVLILLFLCLNVVGAAQDLCVLESKTAPVLLNLKLQMSPEQAQSVLGRDLKIKIKKSGERTFFQNFIEKKAPQTLPGVRALYLRFFDRKLYQIEIFYENRSDWRTLEDFTAHVSENLNLSASSWQTAKGRSEIKCAAVSLVADNVLNPRIEMTDEMIRARVEAIRQKK